VVVVQTNTSPADTRPRSAALRTTRAVPAARPGDAP
jgi:hypothetical protein